ncbi:MAG: hypothetical protein QXW47_02175 [Candidatus Jordarchaeales archaeon]
MVYLPLEAGLLRHSSAVDHWTKVFFICIASSSLGVTTAFAAYLTAHAFPMPSELLYMAIIGGILLAFSCALCVLIYSRQVAENLEEKFLLFQRAERIGLQLVKMGLSLGSLSTLPLAYLFLRPLLNSYTVTQFFPPYLLQALFPLDVYISCLIFIVCFSPACIFSATGLILYRKSKRSVNQPIGQ